MSRGFISKANLAREAQIANLRRGYLSAIAWRQAEWLATQHAHREATRAALRRIMPADRDRALAEDAASQACEEREAFAGLLDFPGARARVVAWLGSSVRELR